MRHLKLLALLLLPSCVVPTDPSAPPDPPADLEPGDDDDTGDDDTGDDDTGDDDTGDDGTGDDDTGDDDTGAPVNAATVVTSTFPTELLCAASSQVSVEVLNSGTTTWTRESGYKLGTVDDSDPFHADTREWLPADAVIPPNSSWLFEFELLAPGTEATFTTDWRMVQEAVEWFGDSASQDVTVSCPGEEPPPWEYTPAIEAAILATATWVRSSFPQYFDLEAIDATARRTLAYEMMTIVLNDLRGGGVLASRCVANPGLPPSDPFYWCSDALVVGPPGIGVTVDIYFSWSFPATPQTAVTGGGSTGVVTSDLVPVP